MAQSASELLTVERDKRADALTAALRSKQVRAERVDLSPSPSTGVNIWKDAGDRYPATTVVVDDTEYAWGHHWEHVRANTVGLDMVVVAITGYLKGA